MHFSPAPMHIPDGFLSTLVAVFCWLIAIPVIAIALRRVNKEMGERDAPLMGVLAAAIFAGQMLNFTVIGGTSGHLLGGALATIVLGPWPAVVVMTAVVSIQALIFQDGGLLALGANLLSMAIVTVLVANTVYRLFRKLAEGRNWSLLAAGFAAAWFSTLLSALLVGLLLGLSGTAPADLALPAMGAIHALIGVGEGLITSGALAFLRKARPDLLGGKETSQKGGRAVWLGGAVVALLLAVLSPLASSHPDGLERVAQNLGFLSAARTLKSGLLSDYQLTGVADQNVATILAGVIGVVLVLVAAALAARSRQARQRDNQ